MPYDRRCLKTGRELLCVWTNIFLDQRSTSSLCDSRTKQFGDTCSSLYRRDLSLSGRHPNFL